MAYTYECPLCDWVGKTKGSLTQHANREHGGGGSLTELMGKYGEFAPKPGGAWRPNRPLSAAPSGVPSVDYAIGIGGLPRGTIVEIYGPAGSGKTLTALTFSAFSQQHGGLAGYADAEHRLQPTFANLVPGLNLDDLHYSEPDGGEQAMNMTKDFVGLGIYDIWTVDSVHACVPKALREKDIGDATMAELAKLMSVSMQVLEPIVSSTNTVVIMVNHVKAVPGVQYGKTWAKPGGSAMDYYPSVQLRVQPIAIFTDDEGRKIGHTVMIKVENSKVSAPYASATYDIFYKEGTIKKKEHERNGDKVVPGIDIASCWFSVGEETGTIVKNSQGKWITIPDAEILGTKREVIEMLKGDCDLKNQLHQIVYGQYARTRDGSILELPKSVVRGELEAEPMNVTEPEMSLEEAMKLVS